MKELFPELGIPIKVRVMGRDFEEREEERWTGTEAKKWVGTITFPHGSQVPKEVLIHIPAVGFDRLLIVESGYPREETPSDDFVLTILGVCPEENKLPRQELSLQVHPDYIEYFRKLSEIDTCAATQIARGFAETAIETEEYVPDEAARATIRLWGTVLELRVPEVDPDLLKTVAVAVIREAIRRPQELVSFPRIVSHRLLEQQLRRMLTPNGLIQFAHIGGTCMHIGPPGPDSPSAEVYSWTCAVEPWRAPLDEFKVTMNKTWTGGPPPYTGNKLADEALVEGLKLLRKGKL